MAFYPLEKLINLYDGYQQAFVVLGKPLLLVQHHGRRYVLVNQCPHQKQPLDRAIVKDQHIQCPRHGMRFHLETGTTDDGCPNSLTLVPIDYDGAYVGVQL